MPFTTYAPVSKVILERKVATSVKAISSFIVNAMYNIINNQLMI